MPNLLPHLLFLLLLHHCRAKTLLPCGGYRYTPADGTAFSQHIRIDNTRVQKVPAALYRVRCVDDVAVAVREARLRSLRLSVKGGGHSAAGYCLNGGGIVVDMSAMRSTKWLSSSVLRIESGAIFAHLYTQLNHTGLLLPGGGCPTVGIAGFAQGGGLSFLSRAYGVFVDSVLRYDVLLANGTRVIASPTTHSSLFWALNGGGGGNYGIVTSLDVQLHRQASWVRDTCYTGAPQRVAPLITAWSDFLVSPFAAAHVGFPALLQKASHRVGHVKFCVTMLATASSVAFAQQLAAAAQTNYTTYLHQHYNSNQSMPTDVEQTVKGTFYDFEGLLMKYTSTGLQGQYGYMTSFTVYDHAISKTHFALGLASALAIAPGDRSIVNFHDGGGNIRKQPSTISSINWRNFNFIAQVKTIWKPNNPKHTAINMKWATQLATFLRTQGVSGAYVNYIDPLLPNWGEAYYGKSLASLQSIKQAVDPTNFFSFKQSVDKATLNNHNATLNHQENKRALNTCFNSNTALQAMNLFQNAQVTMDAKAAASLFTANGTIYIPAGTSNEARGQQAIEASFSSYFQTLVSIQETVTSEMLVSGNVGAFGKQIDVIYKQPTGCRVSYNVMNWFNFDRVQCRNHVPLIKMFHAVFNLTDIVQQHQKCV